MIERSPSEIDHSVEIYRRRWIHPSVYPSPSSAIDGDLSMATHPDLSVDRKIDPVRLIVLNRSRYIDRDILMAIDPSTDPPSSIAFNVDMSIAVNPNILIDIY